MYCNKCGEYNIEDSIYCKKCGNIVNEEYKEEIEEDNKKEPKTRSEKAKRGKSGKTKVKKAKGGKNNVKIKQKAAKGGRGSRGRNGKGSSPLQTFLLFLIFIIMLGVIGVLAYAGYKYYNDKDKVEVPHLVGLTYEQAEARLKDEDLNITKWETKTEDETEDGKVLKQNKKAGKKVAKGTNVRVNVGKYDKVLEIEDYTGLNIDSVKNKLDNMGIKYKVTEEESNEYAEGRVINQSIKSGSKVKPGKTIRLTVSKAKEETNTEPNTNETSEE